MLTKSEIKQITKSISDMPRDSLMQCVKMNLKKHIKCEEKLLDALLQNKSLFQLLIVYHQTTFITLYNQFCKGKEKYLRFQVEWYKHCSIFLLPSVGESEDGKGVDTNEVCDAQQAWQTFCDTYPSDLA